MNVLSKRKYYITLRFETQEDFDKHYKDIYKAGYQQGYEEGLKDALARCIYAFEHEFSSEDIAEAEQAQRSLGIARWKKQRQIEDGIKKLAVDEYIKKGE